LSALGMQVPVLWQTVVLLSLSNIFMTFASPNSGIATRIRGGSRPTQDIAGSRLPDHLRALRHFLHGSAAQV
jgi:hypothetical protein